MAEAVSTLSADPVNAERWRRVPGFPTYRVSATGRVQTKRLRNGMPADDWRDLAVILDGHGYPQVWLTRKYPPKGGRRARWFGVHQLVMLAFRGPPPAGMVVRHILNNNPRDNRLENLGYGTHRQNIQDKVLHGTAQKGEKHPRAKLNDEAVRRVRRLMARCPRGCRSKAAQVFARQYGMSPKTVQRIAAGYGWEGVA